ncbi:MAG: hypothetical protein ACRC33_24020 [Gemmataceae bacterium]
MRATDALIDELTRHGLADADRLWQYLAELGGPGKLPADRADAAALLVRDGLLTPFQADRLLAGEAASLVVSRFRLQSPLGGRAFLAQRPDGRRAAIKVLPAGSPRPAARPHPNLIQVLDYEEHDGRLFVIMEYAGGPSLHERLERDGPLPPVPAARAALDAARALAHLHAAGRGHGAVHPAHLIQGDDSVTRLLPGVGGDPAEDLAALGRTLRTLLGGGPAPGPLAAVIDGVPSAQVAIALLEPWLAEVAPPPMVVPKRPSSQGTLPRPDLDEPFIPGEEQEPPSRVPLVLAAVAAAALGLAGLLWWLTRAT